VDHHKQQGDPMDAQAFGLHKAAYTVNETISLLSLGRTTLYRLVQQGDLPVTKVGSKTLFTAPDIARLLTKLRAASVEQEAA
jgi:excisionase family DNA binding protein